MYCSIKQLKDVSCHCRRSVLLSFLWRLALVRSENRIEPLTKMRSPGARLVQERIRSGINIHTRGRKFHHLDRTSYVLCVRLIRTILYRPFLGVRRFEFFRSKYKFKKREKVPQNKIRSNAKGIQNSHQRHQSFAVTVELSLCLSFSLL